MHCRCSRVPLTSDSTIRLIETHHSLDTHWGIGWMVVAVLTTLTIQQWHVSCGYQCSLQWKWSLLFGAIYRSHYRLGPIIHLIHRHGRTIRNLLTPIQYVLRPVVKLFCTQWESNCELLWDITALGHSTLSALFIPEHRIRTNASFHQHHTSETGYWYQTCSTCGSDWKWMPYWITRCWYWDLGRLQTSTYEYNKLHSWPATAATRLCITFWVHHSWKINSFTVVVSSYVDMPHYIRG